MQSRRRAIRPLDKPASVVLLLAGALLGTTQCVLPRYNYDPDATGAAGNSDGSGADAGFGGDGSGGATGGNGAGGATGGNGTGVGGSTDCPKCSSTQGCVNGTCVEQGCEAQDVFCSGNAVHRCDDDGLGSTELESCDEDEYCDAAGETCREGICAPGQPTCDQNISRLCNSDGTGYVADSAVDCTNQGKTCVSGSCQGACAPKQTRCSGNGLQTCNATGQYAAAVACEDTTCLGEDGRASCQGECAPEQTRCDDNDLQTCNDSGEYGSGAACEDTTCSGADGNASCQGECAPEQTRCDDNDLRTCDDGGQYGPGVACANSTCLGEPGSASCEGECAPGQVQCANNGTQACNAENGQYDGSITPCTSVLPHCGGGECGLPPSCQGTPALDACGSSSNESCCTSARVTGGMYNRLNNPTYPATVATFRLDKFEVTVGRWRKFVAAWNDGWRPTAGAGKHQHLNGGSGLSNSHSDGGYEPGWDTGWASNVDTSGTARQEGNAWSTWTTTPGAGDSEYRPINYVNWYEGYAFCIWDGAFLPSEAEWNYVAAGGGEHRDYPWANPTSPGCGLANYAGAAGPAECNPDSYTIKVGVLINGNGRYGQSDLAGNVWEWQLDWSAGPATAFTTCDNCAYLPSSASNRVQRGGAFNSTASSIINTSRNSGAPAPRTNNVGVRCARAP